MTEGMKVRAKLQGDMAEIKVLMKHPMESGTRKDAKTGNLIPPHFINQVNIAINGKAVMQGEWSGGVSKDPFLGFRLKGVKTGDRVSVSAMDNLGGKFEGDVTVN